MPETSSVIIEPALVTRMEKANKQRRALDAKVRQLKKEEDSIKEEIQRSMGRLRNAPVGDTGRWVQLVTINKDGYTIQPYSYTLVNVLDGPPPK